MNKDNKEIKRSYFYKGLTAFSVVAASVLFFFLIFRLGTIWGYVKRIIDVLQPLIFGLVMAYLVNPMVNFFTKHFSSFFTKRLKNKDRAKSISNVLSVCLALIIFIIIIIGIFASVIPQFISSISNVITVLPKQIDKLADRTRDFLNNNERAENLLLKALDYEKNWLENDLTAYVNKWAGNLASGVWNMVTFLKNFGVGLMFALYFLLSKKLFANQSRKLLCAVMKDSTVEKILLWIRKSHRVFSGFISGKILDSFIIGILCFIGVTALRIPYTVLVAVIVGVTNIIPVFGPYIGAIPCAALILLTNPVKGLYFIVFIILLQTLDGNFIGPKILGDRTGLSTFWVVFAIVFGGGMFGVIGMLIGVPTFAVFYYLFAALINHILKRKNKPTDSDSYTADALLSADNDKGGADA